MMTPELLDELLELEALDELDEELDELEVDEVLVLVLVDELELLLPVLELRFLLPLSQADSKPKEPSRIARAKKEEILCINLPMGLFTMWGRLAALAGTPENRFANLGVQL